MTIDGETVKSLTPAAQRAILELHREYRKKLDQGLIARHIVTLPDHYFGNLSEEYERKLAEIVREGLSEAQIQSDYPVKCPDCGRLARVPTEVQRWKCSCSPHTERMTFQTIHYGGSP